MYPFFETKQNSIFRTHRNETYHFPAHFHNCLEIAFCFSGKQYIKVGEETYTLKKGDAIVIFPNMVHEYIAYDSYCDEPTEIFSIICSTSLLAESVPEIVTTHPQNPYIDSSLIPENVALIFKNIMSAKNNIELLGWTLIAFSNLLGFLNLTPVEGCHDLPQKIVAYIEANFKEKLTINHIAKVFGYHPSYIAHLFCDQLKIPFKTYLGSLRCEYAASQIRTTKSSLTEIAYDCGYNSLNTFCRCFKKHFSKTPSQYKKSIKQGKLNHLSKA